MVQFLRQSAEPCAAQPRVLSLLFFHVSSSFFIFMFTLFCVFSLLFSFIFVFWLCVFLLFFDSFSFSLIVLFFSCPSRRQNRKIRRNVPTVKMTILFCGKQFWYKSSGMAHLRWLRIQVFHLTVFTFPFLFLLCSSISFTYVSLLATVSEINCGCFLRSRCSTQMWCPDDIGRDSLDWVGPPT